MATFYVDLENGSDANNGTTFALRKKTLASVTASAGDEVRVMASPAATSLGQNATWKNTAVTSQTVSSSTAATPAVVTTTAAHNYTTGDTVTITGHATNTNVNGTWKIVVISSTQFSLTGCVGVSAGTGGTVFNITGRVVELASAVTQTIASTGGSGTGNGNRTAYTGVTNVTVTQSTGASKESHVSDQFAVNATFTTGKIAHRGLSSTLNLSGFQQVNLWVLQSAGTLASEGNLRLRLCSDANGDTVVNTINIPAFQATNTWYPVTVNLGTNLGSSINSVSFALTTDQGAQTFRVTNIFASKAASSADSLTLQSLIGKDDGMWYTIQSIDGTRIVLDSGVSTYPTSAATLQKSYTGTAETVTLYKKETIKIASTLAGVVGTGSASNLITVTGGWNRTDMSTQSETDETVIDGQYRAATSLLSITSRTGQLYSNFSLARAVGNGTIITTCVDCDFDFNFITACSLSSGAVVFNTNNTGCIFSAANIEFNQVLGFTSTAQSNKGNSFAFGVIASNGGLGLRIFDAGSVITSIDRIDSNNGTGIEIGGAQNVFKSINTITRNIVGITFSSASSVGNGTRFENIGTVSNNGTVAFSSLGIGSVYIANGSVSGHTANVVTSFADSGIHFKNVDFAEDISIWFFRAYFLGDNKMFLDNTNGKSWTIGEFAYWSTDTDTVQSTGGVSWRFQPTNVSRNKFYPMSLNIARASVSADSLVTVTAWLRRSHADINVRLLVRGGQLAGVDDTQQDVTAAINTWQQVTLTFTPEESGVFELECLGWTDGDITGSGFIDNITITQA